MNQREPTQVISTVMDKLMRRIWELEDEIDQCTAAVDGPTWERKWRQLHLELNRTRAVYRNLRNNLS